MKRILITKPVKQRTHKVIVDQKYQQIHAVVLFKKGKKTTKNPAGTETNNKSIEIRYQRNKITATNNKKQRVNIENRP